MARVRQLLIGLASGSAFYSGFAPALGLGEITLHSALNQPLDAEIELLAADDMSASEIKVGLASTEAFNRSGVDRVYFLNDLRFSPLLRGGRNIIRVVSNQPVREPYLNFIVEMNRPGGQLLREYTLLLDPPTSSDYNAATAPVGDQNSTYYAPPRRTPIASRGERYQVANGESLWTIASRLRVDDKQVSLQDLMLDIHALNPDAFSNGDIHRLRAGVSLLLPDQARVVQAAPAAPSSGPAPEPEPEAPATIAPDTAPQQPAMPQVEMIAQIRRVDEEMAQRTAENLQLQQDMMVLHDQLKDLQERMLERDKQLEQLLNQLAERPSAPTAPVLPEAAAEPAVPVAAPAQPAAIEQPASTGFWNLWNLLLAGLVVLLGLLVALRLRKREDTAREPVEPVMVVTPVKPLVVATPEAKPDFEPQPEPAVPPALDVPLPVRTPLPRPPAAPADDALDGANIYIAYGRLGEAVSALRQAAKAQPQRLDIRYRLLEVLAQQGSAEAFAHEEAELRAAGFDGEQIDELKGRYPTLFKQLPEMQVTEPLDDLDELILELDDVQLDQLPEEETSKPEPAKADDFQLNLDDLSLDADWDLVSPFSPETRKKRDVHVEVEAASTELLDYDARSPFANTMVVEEEPSLEWLDEPQEGAADGFEPFVTSHENLTKLNLALAYIEQDDLEAAHDILNEVINEGDEDERQEARELLARIA